MKRTFITLMAACLAMIPIEGSTATDSSIGSVIAIQGKVTATGSNGTTRNLALKSKIFLNDKVVSEKKSKIQIIFNDNSVISQGEGAEMTIDEYVYSPKKKKDVKCGVKFAKGIFRVVTGKITDMNPDRFKVKTRLATIGIRGCLLGFDITQETEDVFVLGLPKGKSIIIEKAAISSDTIKKGKIARDQVIKILKPGVKVSIRQDQKMEKQKISIREAVNIIDSSVPAPEKKKEPEEGSPLNIGKKPKDPAAPGDPGKPGGPGAPGDPDAPRDPNAPHHDPNAPFDPNVAFDPDAPGPMPGEPGDPDAPLDPAMAFDPDAPLDPALAFDPDAPLDPDAPFDPNAPFDPDAPFDPAMAFNPDGSMQPGPIPMDSGDYQPMPWELEEEYSGGPDGHFEPFFDPDDPDTWPPDPNFDPNNPDTWPDIYFYDPKFDPDDPSTWPPDPFFDPDDPSTWPQPPRFDPDDPATWPDDPNFDPNDPNTWPEPDPIDDGGGPAEDLPPSSVFTVLGPTPPSEFWEWGKWEDDQGRLLTPDVFPTDTDSNGDPVHLLKGMEYGDLVADTTRYTLETVSSINIAAAMFEHNTDGRKLMGPGSCDFYLEVGNGPGTWAAQIRIGDTASKIGDFLEFDVPLGYGDITANGDLVLNGSTMPYDLLYSSKVYGVNHSDTDITFFNVNGEMLGKGLNGTIPVDAVIGWFAFDHSDMSRIKGTFASDLVVTDPLP